jgi:hypothetical protein
MDSYLRNILKNNNAESLKISSETKEYIQEWFVLYNSNKSHHLLISEKSPVLKIPTELLDTPPNDLYHILSQIFRYLVKLSTKIKRVLITKTLIVESFENVFDQLNKNIKGLVHSNSKIKYSYTPSDLEKRTKMLVYFAKDSVAKNSVAKDSVAKDSVDKFKSLNDVIIFFDKMCNTLTPLNKNEFDIVFKKLNINLIDFIESYDSNSSTKLKHLVKFYINYDENYDGNNDQIKKILNELIIFLLLRKFDANKEIQNEFKQKYSTLKSLYSHAN